MNNETLSYNEPLISSDSSIRPSPHNSLSSVDYQRLNRINSITLKCDTKIRNTNICSMLKKSQRRRCSFSSIGLSKSTDDSFCSSIGNESLKRKAFQDSLAKQGVLQFDNGWIGLIAPPQKKEPIQSFVGPKVKRSGQVAQNRTFQSFVDPKVKRSGQRQSDNGAFSFWKITSTVD